MIVLRKKATPKRVSSTCEAGLPIGMHFAARFGDEATLFRLAGQLEQARPWIDQVPSVHSRAEH